MKKGLGANGAEATTTRLSTRAETVPSLARGVASRVHLSTGAGRRIAAVWRSQPTWWHSSRRRAANRRKRSARLTIDRQQRSRWGSARPQRATTRCDERRLQMKAGVAVHVAFPKLQLARPDGCHDLLLSQTKFLAGGLVGRGWHPCATKSPCRHARFVSPWQCCRDSPHRPARFPQTHQLQVNHAIPNCIPTFATSITASGCDILRVFFKNWMAS